MLNNWPKSATFGGRLGSLFMKAVRAVARRVLVCAFLGSLSSAALADVFINEIHYDNSGTDVNERVEIAGVAGTSLAGWSLALYNGGNGTVYQTVSLSGTLASQCGGHGTQYFAVSGIQNGAPDGIALVNASGTAVQFLSYEGSFTASGGPASGQTSSNIGVSETASTLSSQSLQLRGTGTSYADFTWASASTSSWGACNSGQTFSGGTPDAAPTVSSTSPAANATSVAASSNITINFSEAVSVASGWYAISCPSGARTATQSGSGSSYTLNPGTDFAAGETCSVSVIAAKVSDTDGTPTAMASNYNFSFSVAGSASNVLQNGVAVSGIGGAANVEKRYTMEVPSGASNLLFATSGGSGDADLYVRFGAAPTTSTYDCRPYTGSSTESCSFAAPSAGTWHVMVRMYNTVSGVSLTGSYSAGAPDAAPTVTSTSPTAGTSNHPTNGNIGVSFSEAVTLAAGWNTLVCTASGSKSSSVSGSGASYTIDPSVDFTANESCTLTILASKVADVDGTPTPMASNYTLNFGVAGVGSGYYASVNASSSATLRATLHPVIDDHTKLPYSANGSVDTWYVLDRADEDPLNASNILDIYKNATYPKAGAGNNFYNREHTWPKSLGFPNDGASNYPYTDVHMLMLADISHNAARGNLALGDCPAGSEAFATIAYYGQGGSGQNNYRCGNYWQVWDKLKGNVARALFYMDIRYEGGTHSITGAAEPDLILTDNANLITASNGNASVAYMGLLSVLLQWHQADPVDDRERLRNEVVYTYQGNRNPFIDHPEWVACLFQNVCP
jgi:endonuclease I/methionine-rich copper-binding protein CopC